ncbi:MAG: formylglycine-generating enzyme family protein [Cyanobacteria bacterium P01_F01_bin.53]
MTEELGGGITLDLMEIPGGIFTMGSPADELYRLQREGPQHQVRVPAFAMGKYAVTQAQWRTVAALPKVAESLNPSPAHFVGDHRPVEKVSWWEAVEFCQRLSAKSGVAYRLPSEAEWEYACRAGTTTPFHVGATLTADLANYRATSAYANGPKGNYREETTVVGSFPANAFGLYDMHGNVWEWCADYWHDSYEGAPTDGSAWLKDNLQAVRLLRGGSWSDLPRFCRSAFRYPYFPVDRLSFIGFRLSCSAPRTLG